MCNLKEIDDNINNVSSKATRSQWSKIFNKQVPLPTKLNLNKYWSKFGEMMSPSKSKVQRNLFQQSSAIAKKKLDFGNVEQIWQHDESIVKYRYRTCDDEVDENIKNELKEVLSINSFEVCRTCATC